MTENKYPRRTFLKTSTLVAISVAPVVNSLSQVFGATPDQTKLLVDCGFRLTNWKNLLNLEFYFINVDYRDNCLFRKRKIFSRYGQEESYMIVRLPQQHIAEQSYSVPPNSANEPPLDWTAVTMISGYSYLVFRLMFSPNENKKKIPLTAESLLDWNNEKGSNFKLVVRQNLAESLFEIQINSEKNFENKYPFGYEKQADGTYKYSYDKFPKAYGDPITALEFPWRLILSPKLPDQERFKWNWEFSKVPKETKGKIEAELWTAALTIAENPEYNKLLELRKQNQTKEEKENSQKNEVEDIIKKIELMILGSPDYPTENTKTNDIFTKKSDGSVNLNWHILPDAKNRRDLVELYIKYKLIARTNKVTFSSIGISTFLEFKNDKIEITSAPDALNRIFLFSWKQLISFGRDEEVEIVTLLMDKEAGHKYLLVKTTKRRTKKGLSYLDYREYIMPLTPLVDYQEHTNIDDKGRNELVSKFKSPYKSIEVKEIKPKRISPIDSAVYKENDTVKTFNISDSNSSLIINKDGTRASKAKIFYPIEFYTETLLQFEYEATDWQDKKIKFKKNIQAIELAIIATNATADEINIFFDKEIIKAKQLQSAINATYSQLINDIDKKIGAGINSFKEDYLFFRKRVLEWNPYLTNELINELKNKSTAFSNVQAKITLLRNALFNYSNDITTYIANCNSQILALRQQVSTDVADFIIASVLESNTKKIESIISNVSNAFDSIKNNPLYAEFSSTIINLNKTWLELKDKEKEFRNQIKCYQQQIGFTVKDYENELENIKDDTLSNLSTDFVLFKGRLKEQVDGKLDFFNTYSSLPQLQKAQVYVKSLNKIVNEQIPIEIGYAEDYIKNQLDIAKLEIEKNASRVFAKVTESSREYLKGKIRQVASDMGGYLNPEIPVEFLTYLKDPKKVPEKLKGELLKQYPELDQYAKEIQNGYNDLVFISEAAKDQWNTIKQIQPDAFFKGLEARILGSISLKDILGLDFEVPRLSELPDKIVYNFQTDKILEKDFSIVKFYGKNKGKQAALQVYLEKQIKNPNEYKSFTRLSDFSIAIRALNEDVLLILFNKLEVSSSNTQSKKTQVKIDDVSFGGPLNFLGKIAEAIKMPGTGLRVMPSVSQVEIGYAFTLPSIETPAFNLANLKFDVGLKIPFPTSDMVKPITTTFSINRPDDKFLVTVGIFGGRGHFVLEATPQKIVSIDSSIEFGGYFGINLGIASGHVYLFAGIRYQCSGGNIIFTGYLICGGGVTVFGFISVSVTFLLAMTYQNIGGQATLYGSASVRYSVKIGFFKKSFTLSYSKRIAGAKGRTVEPNSDSSTAYIEHTEEPVYYASTSNELMLLPSNSTTETNQSDDVSANDIKSFKTIYPKKSGLWEQYCNSFNFE